MVAPGSVGYGQRQALDEQAAAAPVPGRGGPGGAASAAAGTGGPQPGGAFGPTTRPNEDPMTGANIVGNPTDDFSGADPDMILEILYSKWPSPYLAGLMNR